MKFYIAKAFLLSGFMGTFSFALTDISQEAKKSSSDTVKEVNKVEQSVKNAEKSHKKGDKAAAEKELNKTEVALESAKNKAHKTELLTEKVEKKAEEVSHAAVETKAKTKKASAEVKAAKNEVQSVQAVVHKAQGAAQNIQQAHVEGSLEKAKKHTNEVVKFLEDLEKAIERAFGHLTKADEKTKEADDAVKTQMFLINPKGTSKQKKGWLGRWFKKDYSEESSVKNNDKEYEKSDSKKGLIDKESFAGSSAELGDEL